MRKCNVLHWRILKTCTKFEDMQLPPLQEVKIELSQFCKRGLGIDLSTLSERQGISLLCSHPLIVHTALADGHSVLSRGIFFKTPFLFHCEGNKNYVNKKRN